MPDEFTLQDFGGGASVADEFRLDDFKPSPPDVSQVKLSPYEKATIASGGIRPPSGMESGTEFTEALLGGVGRAAAAVPPTIQSLADIPTRIARGVQMGRGGYSDMPAVGPERVSQAEGFGEAMTKPFVPIPKLDTSPEVDGFTRPGYEQATREVVNFALSIPEFFETPLGIATMGAGGTGKYGATAVRRLFLLDMVKNLAQQYPQMLRDWPNMSNDQKVKAVVQLSGTAALTGGLAKPEMAKVTGMEPPVSPEFAPPVSREAPAPMVRPFVMPAVPQGDTAPMTAPLPTSQERPVEGYQLPMRRGAEPGRVSSEVPPSRAIEPQKPVVQVAPQAPEKPAEVVQSAAQPPSPPVESPEAPPAVERSPERPPKNPANDTMFYDYGMNPYNMG